MFGGLAPLPLRLGGDAQNGWTATQHARHAADSVAVSRAAPLATITVQAGATPTVVTYHGRNGSGAVHAPTVTSLGPGLVRITWASVYDSELFRDGLARAFPWVNRSSVISGHYNGAPVAPQVTALSPTVIDVSLRRWGGATWDLSNERFTLRVFGDWMPQSRIGDYDGATDKEDCRTEQVPYAWSWYQEYTAMLGSGFSSVMSGIVHAKKLTLARFECAKTRAVERAIANSVPSTADDCLGQWVKVLAIPVRDSDERWQIRQRCAAKFRGSLGPTPANVDDSVASLLGDRYIETIRSVGTDLATPPAMTFWPIINPGPADASLGGGAWTSERAHLAFVLQRPATSELSDFLYTANVVLFQHLDRLLPAKCTFNWTVTDGGSFAGFFLDVSHLDFDGLTPS